MKHQIDNRIIAALATSAILLLPACERVLDVVEQLEPPPSGPQPSSPEDGPAYPPDVPSCACASSSSLLPLSCGSPVVPLLDNDVVQTTRDGSVVAFNVCASEAGFDCTVVYWDGSSTILTSGLVLGLSASGRQVLSTDAAGVRHTDLDGRTTILPVGSITGRGALSATGDTVIGAQWVDRGGFLVRANATTGEVEQLGEIGGFVTRAYVTPDASTVVGWGLDEVDLSTYSAFHYDDDNGLTFGLPGLAETSLWPEAVSASGEAVAGRGLPNGAYFRYTEASGLVEIVTASGHSDAHISADGNVVVGTLDPDGSDDAAVFRWTEAGGVVDLTPGRASFAVDLSDDGNVVLANSWDDGQLEGGEPEDALVWDAEHGTRSLDEILEARGVDVTGWHFGHARTLSGDGKVVLGRATCGGSPTLYRVVLSD